MPRDGSGLYSLPAGNPVVTNTIIASSWANTTMADIAAQLNNVFTRDGLLGPTGPFKVIDGTINAPGLAWNSEPGLGWYRTGAGRIQFVSGGGAVQTINGVNANLSSMSITPRVAGSGTLSLSTHPSGSADARSLVLGADNATGKMTITSTSVGALAAGPLEISAPGVTVLSSLNASGSISAGGSLLGQNIELGPTGDGSAFIDFKTVAGDDYTMRLAMWGTSTDYLRVISKTNLAHLQVVGANSGLNFENIANSNGTNTIAFGWRSDGTLGLRVDGTQFGSGWPLTARYVSTVDTASGGTITSQLSVNGSIMARGNNGADGSQFLSYAYNDPNKAVQFYSSQNGGGVHAVISAGTNGGSRSWFQFYENGNATIPNQLTMSDAIINNNIRTMGGHWWRWHWNGDVGDNHFYAFVDNNNQGWATLNSDERLKEDIVPLESSEDDFMKLAPINFRWKKINAITNNERKMDGLSAQNVRAAFPMASFGDFDTPPDENGNIQFPGSVDDRAVLAHVILRVQNLINRVAALEAL